MSQKRSKAKRKEEKKLVSKDAETAMPKKPLFLRWYDTILPGEYTHKQNLRHMIIVFALLVILVVSLVVIFNLFMQKEADSISTKLLIPKSSFVSGQEQNVTDMLEGYGFKNIETDDAGNIICYGTEDMVNQYKDSYKNDVLEPVKELMLNNHEDASIAAMSISDDGKVLTIKTTRDLSEASAAMGFAVANNDIDRIIYVCSNWCQMSNDGEKMTVNIELVGSKEPYYTGQPINGSAIVSELEAKERAKSQQAENTEEDSSNTGEEDAEEAE